MLYSRQEHELYLLLYFGWKDVNVALYQTKTIYTVKKKT